MALRTIKETATVSPYAGFMSVERPFTGDSARRNLKRLMDWKGWSQPDLARESGVSQTHIGGILRGETGISIEYAAKLAKPFGITGWQLIMPNLPNDLVSSDSIRKLVEGYIEASPAGRQMMDAALDLTKKKL